MNNFKVFFTIALLTTFCTVKSQNFNTCGTDAAYELAIQKYPYILHKREEALLRYQEYLQHYVKNSHSKATEYIYKIPVVIHIMHQNGALYNEFITNRNKFKLAVDDINSHFRNDDSLSIQPPFDQITHDLHIEFVLAKLDPNGNPTEGMTLNYLPTTISTAPSGDSLKSIIQWDNHKYLNIWIVPSITGGVGGYAHYPGIADNLDGVVMTNGPLYTPGGLNGLAHECGHWLGLPHPWGAPPVNNQTSNCNYDDGIFDTPNTQGQSPQTGCNDLKRTTCTSDSIPFKDIYGNILWPLDSGQIHDNVQNVMDYAFCTKENFTEGQKVYVRSTLATNPDNGRDSIWREPNLIATGICDTCGPYALFPTAEFSYNKSSVCAGDGIQFTDISYNGTATNWLWNFGDGTTDTVQNPIHSYSQAGTYSISLKASNSNGYTTILKEKIIEIKSITGGEIAPFNENFENSDFPNLTDSLKEWTIINGHNSSSWEKIDGIFATGNSCFGLNIEKVDNNNGNTYKYSIVSPIIDFSNADCNKLTYKWAYAKRFSASAELFDVLVNKNCGNGTWTKVFSSSAKNMGTASTDIVQSVYKPAPSEFKEQEVDLTQFTGRDHILIKFELETNGGNYFYIDDINVGCDTTTGIKKKNNFNFTVYPSPFEDYATLNFNSIIDDNYSLSIYDIIGNLIYFENLPYTKGNYNLNLNILSSLEKGVYFVQIENQNNSIIKKIVKY